MTEQGWLLQYWGEHGWVTCAKYTDVTVADSRLQALQGGTLLYRVVAEPPDDSFPVVGEQDRLQAEAASRSELPNELRDQLIAALREVDEGANPEAVAGDLRWRLERYLVALQRSRL